MSSVTYLLADIGATNARFALGDAQRLQHDVQVLPTTGYSDAGALLHAACQRLGVSSVAGMVLAVAGPVDAAGATITNTGLYFDVRALQADFTVPVVVLNDFAALACGVPHTSALAHIGGPRVPVGDCPRLVLGPGSGLGVAALLPQGEGWRVVASEAGHAGLSVSSHLEAEVWAVLSADGAYLCYEHVLSGPGIERLYRAMCSVWGSQAQPLSTAEICARAESAADPVCHQTLDLFMGWLGSAAGSLALTFKATGGVYIAGGIVPRYLELARQSALHRRFVEHGLMTALCETIPLFVLTEPYPGLSGVWHTLRQELAPSLAERR